MSQPDCYRENCSFSCSSRQFSSTNKFSGSQPSARADKGPLVSDWQVHVQVPSWQPHSIWPFHFKWKTLKSLHRFDICIFMPFPHCANICFLLAKVLNSEISSYFLCYKQPWSSALLTITELPTHCTLRKIRPLLCKPELRVPAWLQIQLMCMGSSCIWTQLLRDTDLSCCTRTLLPAGSLPAFCVCFCASQASFMKLFNSEEHCWSYLIQRSCKITKAGDAFPPCCGSPALPAAAPAQKAIDTSSTNQHTGLLVFLFWRPDPMLM